MKHHPLFTAKTERRALRFIVEDCGELLQDVARLGGEVFDLVHDVAAAMREAVAFDHSVAGGQIASEPIAHLDRWRELGSALIEQLAEIFSCVLAARREDYDWAGKRGYAARIRSSRTFAARTQNSHESF
jgi:hypothetical protein